MQKLGGDKLFMNLSKRLQPELFSDALIHHLYLILLFIKYLYVLFLILVGRENHSLKCHMLPKSNIDMDPFRFWTNVWC